MGKALAAAVGNCGGSQVFSSALELSTCCGWSSTQPRSDRKARFSPFHETGFHADGKSFHLAGELVIAIHQTKQLDNQGFNRPAKFVRYRQTRNSARTATTRAIGRPEGSRKMWKSRMFTMTGQRSVRPSGT